jgi:xylitol oxidase
MAKLWAVPELTNWAGNVTYGASRVSRPASLAELQQAVASAASVHAVGAGHSFSPAADTTGTLISLDDMPRSVAVDSARRQARVTGAVRYAEMAEPLDRAGLAVPNLASLPHITVAGACATGTHGSGDANQCLAAAVRALELVTAAGDVIQTEAAAGTAVSVGALGVVTALTLDLVPAFDVRQWVYDGLPAGAFDAHAPEIFASAYSVSVFTTWRDPVRFDQVWVKHLADDGWDAPPEWFGARLASEPRHPVPGMPAGYATAQAGLPGPWHARLPHFRAEFRPSAGDELQSEYLVGRQDMVAAVRALRPLAARMAPLLLACEIRTVAADSLWLSMAYGRDSAAFHFTWRQDPRVRALLPAIEAALAPFGPRPHWGKLFSPAMRPDYPRLPDFAALAREYDPDGKFRNPMTPGALVAETCIALLAVEAVDSAATSQLPTSWALQYSNQLPWPMYSANQFWTARFGVQGSWTTEIAQRHSRPRRRGIFRHG